MSVDLKMEKQQNNNIQLTSLDLSKPDHVVRVTNQRHDLSDLLHDLGKGRRTKCFFMPATTNNPQDPHIFASWQRGCFKVYSITGNEGIQLKSRILLPDTDNGLEVSLVSTYNPKRRFLTRKGQKKLLVITEKPRDEIGEKSFVFQEIDFAQDFGLTKARTLRSTTSEDFKSLERVLLTDIFSPRVYIRNSIFEIGHLCSTTQSYIAAAKSIPRTNRIYKNYNRDLKEIFKKEFEKFKREESDLLEKVFKFYHYLWDSSWDGLIARRGKVTAKDVNERLFSIKFDIYDDFIAVVKVYDKLSRKTLKKVTILPGRILGAAERAEYLIFRLKDLKKLENG